MLMLTRTLSALMVVVCLAGCPMEPGAGLHDTERDYSGARPVFPGAQGYGIDTRAGCDGEVIRVTNLDAEGPGSLRAALETPRPRTIVFEVGGIIDLKKALSISQPYVTVAGQTAPPPGITVIGAGMTVATHDVLVQHLRFRVGDRPDGPAPTARDGISVVAHGPAETFNVVIDHCSVSWAVDEGMSTWSGGVHDVTFSNCIVAENLSRSIHPENEHSKGLLIGDHARRIAVVRCLFAHNMRRNPFIKGNVSALVVNNLIYNPGTAAIHLGDLEGSGPSLAGIFGNVLIPGPDTRRAMPLVRLLVDMKRKSAVYARGNDPGHRALWRSVRARHAWKPVDKYTDSPVRVLPMELLSGEEVAGHVLASAGAWPAHRDGTDTRIVDSVRQGTGRIIDSQGEVGGFPPAAQAHHTPELPPEPAEDDDDDGYTNLEEWLHSRAAAAEGR